jgi:hypothetical protein
MENYQIVKKCIEENECVLLTTFEEFEEMRKTVLYQYYQYVRVKITGSCSHESSVVFTNFKLRMTGKRCITCIRNEQKETLKKNKNANEIEYEGIKLLEEYLSVQYEVIRTGDYNATRQDFLGDADFAAFSTGLMKRGAGEATMEGAE